MDNREDGRTAAEEGAPTADSTKDNLSFPQAPPGLPLAEIRVYRGCKLTVNIEETSAHSMRPVATEDSVLSLIKPVSTTEVKPVPTIAGGRTLPKLLFITNKERLASNIGRSESADVHSRLVDNGFSLIDDLTETTATTAAQRVRKSLSKDSIKGVVIVGGYDVIPAQLLDCLPRDLRTNLPKDIADADSFRIWSDDVYGDVDGDGLPELPVSRISDGRSSELVLAALNSTPTRHNGNRFGLRNVDRPAAEGVFAGLAGNGSMLKSSPLDLDKSPTFKVDADNVYMWLHGAFWDATTFWGQDENTGVLLDAFNRNVPSLSCSNVVLAAACWGGLTVDTPAGRFQPNTPIAPVAPESSIALTFLLKGAVAFIGCTGSHYSPTGAPLHIAFWRAIQAGVAPAEALLRAKLKLFAECRTGIKARGCWPLNIRRIPSSLVLD